MDYLWDRALMGHLNVKLGNIREAREIFAETTREALIDKDDGGVVSSLEGMASLYVALGKHEIAAELIGWVDTTLEKNHEFRMPLEQADVDKIIAACIAMMGEVAFSEVYEEGKKMTLNEAVALALSES
jgi:hypothetical protein